jgi:hypothetical protein
MAATSATFLGLPRAMRRRCPLARDWGRHCRERTHVLSLLRTSRWPHQALGYRSRVSYVGYDPNSWLDSGGAVQGLLAWRELTLRLGSASD